MRVNVIPASESARAQVSTEPARPHPSFITFYYLFMIWNVIIVKLILVTNNVPHAYLKIYVSAVFNFFVLL